MVATLISGLYQSRDREGAEITSNMLYNSGPNRIAYGKIFMPTQDNMFTIPEVLLSNIRYAFFTNERGESQTYLLGGEPTRNINLYSSAQKPDAGFDPADRVLANIQKCFTELGATDETHQFVVSTNYANMGKSAPLIMSCSNVDEIAALKSLAFNNLQDLGLEGTMHDAIAHSTISVIKADALIFKGVPGESIAVLGASGDAHPIMMFDDNNQIACYIAGAHTALKQGVLAQSFDRMIALGANQDNIRLVIGPGLGPRSYEFGDNAPAYFNLREYTAEVLTPVLDTHGNQKYLVNIEALVCVQLRDKLDPQYIYNIDIDTMAFDLYDEGEENGTSVLKRKITIDFEELNEKGPLFSGARRFIMSASGDLRRENSSAFSQVPRNGTGFFMRAISSSSPTAHAACSPTPTPL